MAGLLLIAVLLHSFRHLKAQGLLPPSLTVNPAVITETDSVTLNCQTPSVSESNCYFNIRGRQLPKRLPCLEHVLTGTELLSLSNQTSPAEVKVSCFYLKGSLSPESNMFSVIVRTTRAPTLTVNPSVISDETDSVTLKCQTPLSVSVSHCHILTLSGGSIRVPSCLQTLTGSELLKMSHQSSPAEVKLSCFYSVKLEREDSPSPHSASTSITIHSKKPKLICEHSPGNSIHFTCSLPGPARPGTKCNLYFGETNTPAMKTTIWSHTNPQQLFCGFTLQVDDFLRKLSSAQQKVASCDYTLGGPQSLSPRSDEYILTDIVKMETPTVTAFTVTTDTVKTERPETPTEPVSTVTTGHDASTPGYSTTAISADQTSANPTVGLSTNILVSTFSTSVKQPPGLNVSVANTKDSTAPTKRSPPAIPWKYIVLACGFGVTVGIVLMVSTFLCNRRRAGSEQQKRQETPNPEPECYYSTITDEPAVMVQNGMYSTVQRH